MSVETPRECPPRSLVTGDEGVSAFLWDGESNFRLVAVVPQYRYESPHVGYK
ncbi:hypothetical protein KM295_11430 [Natronomonas sp. F2-12]|uniref:Uncharacterized protein n=1 Tax=Natronomonas aquatica TaxID=2841590 RepID=A0A9R1D568_9EURY|nr:hypothetical protein [Natronomonas aquatica]MCQ4334079.1 hypothetical protein [Natronomonas aquatica]